MFSFLFNLSSYYLRIERLAILSVALLFVAFLSFTLISSFGLKFILFIIYSVVLFFNSKPIIKLVSWMSGRKTPTTKEQELIQKVRGRWLSLDKQEEMFIQLVQKGAIRRGVVLNKQNEHTSGVSWTATAMSALVWVFLLELLITLGGARWLAQFPIVQGVANLIPSDIFLKHGTQRDEYNILLLKIFKIVNVSSLPLKVWATYVLAAPFWKNPKTFPISPMVIYMDKESDTFQKIIKSLWPLIAFFALFFCVVSATFSLIFSGYTNGGNLFERNNPLDVHMWLWMSLAGSICLGVAASCFARIVIDGFSMIVIIFRKP